MISGLVFLSWAKIKKEKQDSMHIYLQKAEVNIFSGLLEFKKSFP